jgi:tRNA A-37 threonylcarbamoyl transferase component Bud32
MTTIDRVRPGDILGRYELLLRVARGGMASVWAARLRGARGFTKLVAIKTMLPDISEDPDLQRMFLEEARIASGIRHPNVAQTLELGEEEGLLYIAMEWIDGETLSSVLKEAAFAGGVPLAIALKIAIDACHGVHAAHELHDDDGRPLGLVHRDVSPPNILVSFGGDTKLVDFGVAKAFCQLDTVRTQAGIVKGKFRYMAPEQLLTSDIDRRADIFSLGIILFQLTTGQHPWQADTHGSSPQKMLSEPPMSPSNIDKDYPPSLERIVTKALARDPAGRFQTAAEMARALADCAEMLGKEASKQDLAFYLEGLLGARGAARRDALKLAVHEVNTHEGDDEWSSRLGGPTRSARPVAFSIPEICTPRTPAAKRAVAAGLAAALLIAGYAIGGHGSGGATAAAQGAAVLPANAAHSPSFALVDPFETVERAQAIADKSVPAAAASSVSSPTKARPILVKGAGNGRAAPNVEPELDVGF